MSDELPKHGSGERGLFKYDEEKKKLVRIECAQSIPLHYVITDTMDPIEYMGSDRREIFESKSAYRRRLKQDGYRELGNDNITPSKPDREQIRREIEDDVEKAYHDIKNARVPISEKERQCNIEEKRKMDEWKRRNWHLR